MSTTAISELLKECSDIGNFTPEYYEKMQHKVPAATVVQRERFIFDRCKDRTVVNFGSESGKLHEAIKKVAKQVWGVDKEGNPDFKIDLDGEYQLHRLPVVDVYVCGELIEHLANPGQFLRQVKIILNDAPLIVTVPNAFADTGRYWMQRGVEQINRDHVAWYSWHTLKTLVERVGLSVDEFHYYGEGRLGFNEGLIFVVS